MPPQPLPGAEGVAVAVEMCDFQFSRLLGHLSTDVAKMTIRGCLQRGEKPEPWKRPHDPTGEGRPGTVAVARLQGVPYGDRAMV